MSILLDVVLLVLDLTAIVWVLHLILRGDAK